MSIDPIDIANAKSLEEFVKDYLPQGEEWSTWIHPKTNAEYQITLQPPKALSTSDFDACFNLIHSSSYEDYKKSKDGWKPRSKKKEMKLLDLKYLVFKDNGHNIEGFLSFMPTFEDDCPVVYCYEIHLSSALQGTGLGTVLMRMLEAIAKEIPGTEKVMLTCFTTNKNAHKFYEKLGYAKDKFSPPPKILRNGTKVEAEYVILSKIVPR